MEPGAAATAPVPAPAPEALLIMVDGGQYRELASADAVLRMGVTKLLKALRRDGDFAEQLKGVVLTRAP